PQLPPRARAPGSAADAPESLDGLVVERRHEQVVVDEPALQQALEFGVGPGQPVQRAREDRIRLLAAEEQEELVPEEQRRLCSTDRVVDQRPRLLQVLDGGLAV